MTIHNWSTPPDRLDRKLTNRIDVWRVLLDPGSVDVRTSRLLLSQDEIERADRFHFDKHRNRFTICRAALRKILEHYLDVDAGEIRFTYNQHKKPGLHPQHPIFEFNVSHSDDLAVIACSNKRVLGIDVEYMRDTVEYLDLASRFFAETESTTLQRIGPDARKLAFYNCWTRKESYLKAKGSGLAVPLSSFAVTLAPDDPVELVHSDSGPEEVARWRLISFTPKEDFVGALTAEQGGWSACGIEFPAWWLQ